MQKIAIIATIFISGVLLGGSPRTAHSLGLPPVLTFTDTRVTPVGNDKLTVGGDTAHDSWSVDLAMNHENEQVNGQLTPEHQFDRIWEGTGPGPHETTINTKQKMHTYYNSGVVFYQYRFHNTNSQTNTQTDINGPVYSYQL